MKVDKALLDELAARNAIIAEERKKVYDDAMGIQPLIFMNLPQYLTVLDLMREKGIQVPPYNLAVVWDKGWEACDDVGMLATVLQRNLRKNELMEILTHGTCCGVRVMVAEHYWDTLKKYINEFES